MKHDSFAVFRLVHLKCVYTPEIPGIPDGAERKRPSRAVKIGTPFSAGRKNILNYGAQNGIQRKKKIQKAAQV